MSRIILKDVKVSYPDSRVRHERRVKSRVQGRMRRILSGERPPKKDGLLALKGVSIEAGDGDVVGIVGENGAGKTTLLRVISRLLTPDSGTVRVEGTVSTVFSLGAGFIPSLSGLENIHLVGSLYGLSKAQIAEIEAPVVDFSELGEAIERPVKTYSSGMRARLGFSIVSFLDTPIIALDETLAVGDFRFRKKAGNLIERYAHDRRILVVVSHSHRIIREYCNKAYYLHRGKILAEGQPDEVCDEYEQQPSSQQITPGSSS